MHEYNLRKRILKNYVQEHDVHVETDFDNVFKDKVDEHSDDERDTLLDINEPDNELRETFEKRENEKDWKLPTLLMFISIFTRIYAIDRSSIVVWDEAHFGKFANWYIKRTFYFDVHPPLGKMMIALFGWIFGYNGDFSFDSGSTYTKDVPFKEMRAMCAIIGALSGPLMYGIAKNLGMKRQTATLVATLVIFDNALLTISKFILLDPLLLTFTCLSIFCATKFSTIRETFSMRWISWLTLTGLSLGLTMSIKWVGLFTYAFVGCLTIKDLWNILGSRSRMSSRKFTDDNMKHWSFRILLLILLPLGVYMSTFMIHFKILENSGPGDTLMSSLFQSTLKGSKISQGPPIIGFNSRVTLRNKGHGAGLLHSHNHGYPHGSKQSQVTLYSHRDSNNWWSAEKPWKSENDNTFIYDKDTIRLFHTETKHNLHSHQLPAPISVYSHEVSTYGNSTIGDMKDHFVVEIVENGVLPDPENDDIQFERIHILSTTFRLRHALLGCYLASSGQKLPEWGFGQGEVICSMDTGRRSLWNVEEHKNDELENEDSESIEYPRSTFEDNFIDLNMAMWHSNNGLTPKVGKKDILISNPSDWPFAYSGIRLCNWNEETVKFFLLGNTIVWWSSILSIIGFLVNAAFIRISQQANDGYIRFIDKRFLNIGQTIFIGYILHYIPFFIMGRVLYLHHYFNSMMISTLMLGLMFERMLIKITRSSSRNGSSLKQWMLTMTTCSIYLASFLYFSPISYGFTGKADEVMTGRKWRESWNLY